MNITDIDDKIIKRARQNHLYEKYVQSMTSAPLDQLLNDQKLVLEQLEVTCARNFDADKKVMLDKMLERMNAAIEVLKTMVATGNVQNIEKAKAKYFIEAKDPIAEWVDKKEGDQVSDNRIFEALPRYWEDEFHNDMKALNVSIKIHQNTNSKNYSSVTNLWE